MNLGHRHSKPGKHAEVAVGGEHSSKNRWPLGQKGSRVEIMYRKLPEKTNRGIDCTKLETPKNRRHKLLCELLLDYAKNTTLHGLRYTTERGISAVEKIFWIITFVLSLSLCMFLIRNVWVKWRTSPVIVSLSEQLMSVTEVPFPAVTICPQIKINPYSYNYTEQYINITKRIVSHNRFSFHSADWKKMCNIGLICNHFSLCQLDTGDHYTDHTAVQDINEAAPQLTDISIMASWHGHWLLEKNSSVFEKVLTREGVCFTFNSLAEDEIFNVDSIQKNYSYLKAATHRRGWSMEDGYFNFSHNSYPRRGRANGAKPDLELLLSESIDHDTLCDGPYHGYKVYLHHPADQPQSSLYYYAALPGQTVSFAIKLNVLKTSESLRSYQPHIRQCYFPSEKELRYFRVYTPSNCRLECLTNYTLERCDCIWFHMPHNDSTVLCTAQKTDCVTNALEQFAADDGFDSSNYNLCQCLPTCSSIHYDAEVLKTSYDNRAYGKSHTNARAEILNRSKSDDKHFDRYTKTKIEMYFKEPRFVSMCRSELFGLTDFLANCGGLLGLFLGFSFLSVAEIFYFLTLRLGCMLKREKRSPAEKKKRADRMKIV